LLKLSLAWQTIVGGEEMKRERKSWLKIHIACHSRKIYQEIEKRGARSCRYLGKGPPTQRDKHIEEILKIEGERLVF
jgi:hypothetical protein